MNQICKNYDMIFPYGVQPYDIMTILHGAVG
jgi:hypothetical protein